MRDKAITLYAVSTGQGRAGIAVIRVSGPQAKDAIISLTSRPLPSPRVAVYRRLYDPVSRETLDRGLVLWFPGPESFTGEDMAEFHIHGGKGTTQAVMAALAACPGLRMAEPGEFTRRAFENGKIDLSEAEGLADLVNAETDWQRRQALEQSSGSLRRTYENWRKQLLTAMALVETGLDFADESDVPSEAMSRAVPLVARLANELEAALTGSRRGEIIRDGIRTVIIGAPNAGKSTLLNALAQRDAAIVSDEPGTTRDVVEVRLDLDGYPFILSDTAGLRDEEKAGEVEKEGMRRALDRAADADIVLHILDAGNYTANNRWLGTLQGLGPIVSSNQIVIKVLNKIDIAPEDIPLPSHDIALSAKTGEGMDALRVFLVSKARIGFSLDESPLITRHRHRQNIGTAHQALRDFLDGGEKLPELLAEDLRAAAIALERLTGRVDVEDVLGKIFSDFCIGK